jgi:hypothetical protein
MNVIDILALIFAIIVIVKMAVLFLMPKKLSSFANNVFDSNKNVLLGISLSAILIVGYFVLTNVAIVTILAVMLFTHVLFGAFFMLYPKEIKLLTRDIMKDTTRIWLVSLIYVVLSVWGIVVILG